MSRSSQISFSVADRQFWIILVHYAVSRMFRTFILWLHRCCCWDVQSSS